MDEPITDLGALIRDVVESGRWIIRADMGDGLSHGGFRWRTDGAWVEAPD